MDQPARPEGLGPSGRQLWDQLTETLVFDVHEDALLREACRVVDRLDALNHFIDAGMVILADGTPNPALVEARQQQLVFTRLIASLRLPEDLEDTTARPQRRGAARGAYLRSAT